ncbi:protein nervous wreck isoform X2 [Hermetia illucens]|uniref:protein nervous wreck isoform X2 n=1 Tax=Hermetia illucens TaxID=343691 RepID=UPI0018CC04F0|nr:protein nervous wreck isoform X2 [Hermetia illucens]
MSKKSGNYVKFLKNLHTEQVAKLQLKNQHECDLLEDIRQFTIKRSAIEKSYSEALLKISSAYLNKKIPNIPDIKVDGMEERWNMWSVWRTVLEENEKLARARLAAIEVFQQQIADEAKVLRDYKLQISKKCLNQLANIQKELQVTVSEVDKTKKQYFDEEHCAHDVRDKARDIEEKLKKKKGSFFQSITSLQKNSARVTTRKEQLEEKSTGARNDYLLSLASANAHQNRYFTVDLQTTMTSMENYVFERIAEYLTLMGRTELLTCSATQNSFGKIRDQAQQLSREYNLQCCYLFYPVLKQHIQYDFEPCDNDPVFKITAEHDSAADTLAREAKMLAARVVRENNSIRENARKLAICVSMRDSGQKTDPNDPNGPDLDTKIEEFRELIRKSETEKARAEACLECLRAGGINVDEWVQEAESLGVHELTRSASSISMRTDASGQGENPSSDSFYDSDNAEQETQPSGSALQDDRDMNKDQLSQDGDVDVEQERQTIEQLTAGWEDPTEVDWSTEDTTVPEAAPAPKDPIFKCTAIYSYTAQNPDELSIVENEQLEVIGEGDGDGWLRARNYKGEEGYVPHNYLDVEQDSVAETGQNQLQTQISFSSVDYTVDNEDQTQDSVQSPDQVSVIMAPGKKKSSQEYCIALYDYDATAQDELTFEEGQIIKIITKSAHGVDDGWWEGELDGKVGNFPSLVVEECDENGEPLTEEGAESPLAQLPPGLSLPAPPALPAEYADSLNEKLQDLHDLQEAEQEYDNVPQMPPPVLVQEDVEEEESGQSHRSSQAPEADSSKSQMSLGIGGMAQIIVTAATPMVDDGDKSFPPKSSSATEASSESDQATTKSTGVKEKQKTEEPAPEESLPDQQSEVSVIVTEQPPSPPAEQETKTPVEEEKPAAQEVQDENHFEANFEANFDANFDDAFGAETDSPKQVVGGRASIPEELAPHQLARLQDLKESNA